MVDCLLDRVQDRHDRILASEVMVEEHPIPCTRNQQVDTLIAGARVHSVRNITEDAEIVDHEGAVHTCSLPDLTTEIKLCYSISMAETIDRSEFYSRLGETSPVLSSIPLSDEPPIKEWGTAVLQLVRAATESPYTFEDYLYRNVPRDLEEIVLNGSKGDDDPLLSAADGLIKMLELAGRSLDAQRGHPFDLLVSFLSHIDVEERPSWVVVMHPAVWTEARLSQDDLWFTAACSEKGKIAGTTRIVTPLMEDRSILMFRPDKVDISISDVEMSTTASGCGRARLLLRLGLDTEHAQHIRNLG